MVAVLVLTALGASKIHAQQGAPALQLRGDVAARSFARTDTTQTQVAERATRPPRYWRLMAAGFATSLLAHEAAHVATAYAVGAHPHFGFDKGRPTVYSGINSSLEPHKQFLFSSMGLDVQAALDEAILDVPHDRGAPFERGVLAGGIATALFYVTLGRVGSVSDVAFITRTSSLSTTDVTLIYGGVALLHTLRIARDGHYANFFVRPAEGRGVLVGVRIEPVH